MKLIRYSLKRYDLTIYYRDSLIATSGTIGDWIDVSHLPVFLGTELPERLQKWIAYKKNGQALYDSSQEGSQMINTTFNGYDDTIKAQCIQAFEMVLQSIEQQASSITGVFAEKLGQIQQRDAVSNVKIGIRQSTLLTKQYFSAMDSLYKEVNYDLLNEAKIVYKKGICGTLINGNKLNEVFTAEPKYYTVTDFDIHIQDSSEMFQVREQIKAMSTELIKAGLADPAMIVNILMARSLTDLKDYINDSVASKKKENDAVMQLQQQLQQMQEQMNQAQQQMQQLQADNNKLQNQLDNNSQEKIKIDQKRVLIEEEKMRNDKDYNDKIAANKEKQVQLEMMQVSDSNPYNDKIKNV